MAKVKKKIIKQKLVILAAFISGISISIYVKSFDKSKLYISLNELKEIEIKLNYYNKELNNLLKSKKEYEEKLIIYKNTNKDEGISRAEFMKDELKKIKISSGYGNIKGSGIEITIKDSEKELKEGQNPNDLLVHDGDVLRIINDLKKSGAEAISINGERLVSYSEIKCSGATITVNGVTHGQPFIIKAIGDNDVLKASLLSPESYSRLLQDLYGIKVIIEEKSDIFIKSYKKDV